MFCRKKEKLQRRKTSDFLAAFCNYCWDSSGLESLYWLEMEPMFLCTFSQLCILVTIVSHESLTDWYLQLSDAHI